MKADVTVKGKDEVRYFDHIISCGVLNLTNNGADFVQAFKDEKLNITYHMEDAEIEKSSDTPNIIKSKVIVRFYKRMYYVVPLHPHSYLQISPDTSYSINHNDVLDHEEEYDYDLDFNYDPEKFTEICIHQLDKICRITEVVPRTDNTIVYYVNAGIMNLEESKEEYSKCCADRDKRNKLAEIAETELWKRRADMVKETSSLKYKFTKLIKMIFGGKDDK